MEKVRTEDAVDRILATDVTEVVLGVKKGPLSKKGHLIEEKDISKFLSIGKHSKEEIIEMGEGGFKDA